MSQLKKKIRENFRNDVFKRDGYKCRICGATENLDAHHITDRHEFKFGGYVKENGISLCPVHHQQAELWHSSGGKEFHAGMTPTDLYKKIFSTFEKAVFADGVLGRRIGDKNG